MRKFPKILSILNLNITNESKSTQIEKLMNKAILDVLNDYHSDLSTNKLFNDTAKATTVKKSLEGQVGCPDYPDV